MKVQIPIKCPGCEEQTLVATKRPGFMDKRILSFRCIGCDSGMTAIVSKAKPGPDVQKNQCDVKVKVSSPSKKLMAQLKVKNAPIHRGKMQDAYGREIKA